MGEFNETEQLWAGNKSRADDLFERIEIALPGKLKVAWKDLHIMACIEGADTTLAILKTITPARVDTIENAVKSDDASISQDAKDILYSLKKVLPKEQPSLKVYAIWNEREHEADSVSRAKIEAGQKPETQQSPAPKRAKIIRFKTPGG